MTVPINRRRFTALAGSALVLPHFAAHAASASDNAYGWLKRQLSNATGLYASFAGGNVAYTYDQAVLAIAALVKGDAVRAKNLLNVLKGLQASDGSLCNAYYTTNKAVQEGTRNVGPNIWVAMAVMAYEKFTGDTTTFRSMAQSLCNWALNFQQSDGGINGGLDAAGNRLSYASTEHQLDAYAALRYFGYGTQATRVKSFLDNVVWSTDHFIVGRNDNSNHVMDVNTWGVLALGLSGTHNYNAAQYYNMSYMRTTQSLNGVSYDAFDFNDYLHDIWFEGSSFMVLSLAMDSNTYWSQYFLNQILKNQDSTGGVQYSLLGTNNGYWTMTNKRAISSTGWLVFALANYNPFQV
jgi:hypothetical protein